MNLLNSLFYIIGTVMLAGFAIIFACTIVLMLVMMKKKGQKISALKSKTDKISYTEILSSGGGTDGSVMTFGSDGGMGSFSSEAVTKFLVVYTDGTREIATVRDDSELCSLYLSKLKG